VKPDLHFDYTTVGHVTIDVLADGSCRAGGTAFYSALQASRLGQRALIVTRGVATEIEELIEPYRDELELEVLPARETTTLRTFGSGSARTQRVLAWAGPIAEDLLLDTSILHLAPVARESPTRWRGRSAFVGLTPQGLVREWAGPDDEISLAAPASMAERMAERCDAIVVSEHESASCTALISRARTAGAVVAVTDGAGPNTILLPGGGVLALEVPEITNPCDDLGAGDVFAAAFFVALAEGRSPERAASFANAAAAVRMQGAGAAAIGDMHAIETRLHAAAGAPG
jgi:1D-myo-inositol 3-kinase